MKYVIYCRRSSDEKSDKQTQSIPDQIKRCIEYAEREGIEIMKKPVDFSYFETEEDVIAEDNDPDLWNRKIFQGTRDLFIVKESKTAKDPWVRIKRRKLVSFIEKNKINGLLSYSPDRQARNMLEWGELINLVDQGKVSLKYTNFNFEVTAAGKMMLGIWFVFAKQYSDAISENVLRGNDETVWRGKSLGNNKHGYYRDETDGYYKVGKHFELIQKAFRMKIDQQKSDQQIADWLNDEWRTYKYGDQTLRATANKMNIMFKDPFYYGLYIIGDRISDQTLDNKYFKPMITKDDFEILQDRRSATSKDPITLQTIKDEYVEIRLIPRDFAKSEDGYSLTPNLPNKKRYMEKLNTLQAEKPNATLKDVVMSHQIKYSVKQIRSKYQGLEINGDMIEKVVAKYLDALKITEEQYQEYVFAMNTKLQKAHNETIERVNVLNMRINTVRGQLTTYIQNNMHFKKDKLEGEVYENKKKEFEAKMVRLERERESLGNQERHAIVEYESFLNVMQNAGAYYRKASYVQKARITQIFFSNIVIDTKKRLHLAVKPLFKDLFILNGAGNAEHFEHIHTILSRMDDKTAISLVVYYRSMFSDTKKILASLTPEQQKFYQIS